LIQIPDADDKHGQPRPRTAAQLRQLERDACLNGFVDRTLPTIAAPALIATTATPSMPTPARSTISTGTSG
jgi:hypothetical protein